MKNPFSRTTSYFMLLFLLITFPVLSQDMNQIDLGGRWRFRKAGTTKWMDANVPGCVHLDLLKNGIITEPFYRDNEKYQQWIGESGWEYEKQFFISDTLFANRNIELVCKGLDTYANVFLNDSLQFVADNMFKTWYSNVKFHLRSGLNTIKIQFPSVIEIGKDKYNQLKYKLPGEERVVTRKAAYHFGWDWGPTFITSGIWQPIYIRYWGFVNVMGVQYIQKKLTDDIAEMTAVFTVNSGVTDSGSFRIANEGKVLAIRTAILKKGVNVVRVDFSIKNPKRWWTNGLGEAYLYPLDHEVRFAGKLYGKGTTKIGLRTLELVQEKDSIGKSFYFRLNGIPVFMKGANYIPQDNFLARVKDTMYRDLIRSAKEANMNMLRVWGGGIYEKDIFYDYCDQNGILVWQDFMFACAMYPGGKEFVLNVQSEAIQNIVRLRNHPCIALWCGNNEIEEGWRNWGWQKQYNYSVEDSVEIFTNYKIVFESLLPEAVSRFDTLRPYISTSPKNGWGNIKSMTEGDSHYWGVWHGKEPFDMYKKKVGRFMSEYGFQGFPDMATIRRVSTPPDWNFDTEVMKIHQKSPIGFATINEYMLRDFNKPKNFENYAYVSQILQAEGMKIAIEAHRRAMPRCMGTLYWQLNDCWPVVSWSSRDYYGRKKALHYWLKSEYGKFLVSPVIENDRCRVYVVSDQLTPQPAELSLNIIDFTGNVLWTKAMKINVPANGSAVIFDTAASEIPGKFKMDETLLVVKLKAGDQMLSENLLYFDVSKNLKLESPKIVKIVTEIDEGYKIELSTDKLARAISFYSPWRGEFSDDFFDLLPGQSKTVIYKTTSRNMNMTNMLTVKSLTDSY